MASVSDIKQVFSQKDKVNMSEACIHRFVVLLRGGGVQCAVCNETWHNQLEYGLDCGEPLYDDCLHSSLVNKLHGIMQCSLCGQQFKDTAEAESERSKQAERKQRRESIEAAKFITCKHNNLTYLADKHKIRCDDCNGLFDSVEEAKETRQLVEAIANLPARMKAIKAAKAKAVAVRLSYYL